MKEPLFLTLAEVIEIHKDQIGLYGGSFGTRDIHLLESAVAQPQASFGGEWAHRDLYEMAAAYAFHIAQNHAFIDGNKRAALASTLVFLEIKEIHLTDPKGHLKNAMLFMASGKTNKQEFTALLHKLPKLKA